VALSPGTRLGPYEIVSALGAGGMGEVYRARDTKLNRDVALKVIPETFALDADRLARFTREAQVLASLNHPHIAAIYGFEDSGATHALVLELVEGDTLAERLAQGSGLKAQGLPLEEALPIARQICEALEAAHEQGIIHRDLKPANIKVTPDGVVKVLDFGLAKLARGSGLKAQGTTADAMMSPTITSPAMPFDFRSGHPEQGRGVMTGVGVILGTAAYMSPEQAKGREADTRSDIWAFGCVLFEMLAGRRPFDGEDVADTLAAVLRADPDWTALPQDVPAPIRTLLRSCLEKDRRKRMAAISAALFVLDHADTLVERVTAAPDHAYVQAQTDAAVAGVRRELGRSARRRIVLFSAAAVMAAGLLTGGAVWLLTRPAPPSVVRTTITTSGSTALRLSGFARDVAITPDGSRVVYHGDNQLLVRALNQLEPTVLSGLGGPQGVFVSPDGQWVGFFDGNTIKKVAITGGPPVPVCATQGAPRGATWSEDGTIVFATNSTTTGLLRVSAAGGEPVVLTKPDRERGEGGHLWPELLPGGKAVLFTIAQVGGSIENAQIAVLDLQTGRSKVLIGGGSDAHYVPTGHLVYGVKGTLRAVAFDLGRLEVVGTPAPVLEGVATTTTDAADVGVAANGSLVYIPGVAGRQTVVSVDRQGRASPLPGLPLDEYRDVRVSPDGARLALATQTDVWTYDVVRATLSRLTTASAAGTRPLWTPDGQRIIFTSRRAGYPELFWRPADGTGSDERLLARAKDLNDLLANGWSADGRQLLFSEGANLRCAIGQIAIERPSEATVLVKNEFCNARASVSPDGRWMAYESNVSGRNEIYAERYPALGNRQQISTGGGILPLWSRDGRELFFSATDGRQMFAVPVQSGTTLVAGRPQVLFEFAMLVNGAGNRPYDIAPDGRFVMIRSGQAEAGGGTASNLIVVQNWFEELKRLVPVN
jgi:serine/threonine-protein kinase